MWRAKQDWEEFNDLGMSIPNSTKVCSHHFDNYGLKEFVLRNADWGNCDYCNSKRKVIAIADLLKFIGQQINYFYRSADDESISFESREGGYQGPVFDGYDLLEKIELDVDNDILRKHISTCFQNQMWCKKNPFDPFENKILLYNWNKFSETVKHKSRYVFFQTDFNESYYDTPVHNILNRIGRIVEDLSLFKSIKIGTKIYRSRQHKNENDILSGKNITSPPNEYAKFSNRMSPAGISMFYGGFDSKTCYLETVDFKKILDNPYYTTAYFKNNRVLTLIDLTKLPEIPSIFDESWGKFLYVILFMKDFIKDLSKDIARDDKEHYEYVPTQIVTEFFRYSFKAQNKIPVDGIIYPSAKNRDKNALVLFFDNKASLDVLEYEPLSKKTMKL